MSRDSFLLRRADEAFAASCATGTNRSTCRRMGATLDAYAAFHHRVFAADTPCSARRVLIVRESFSDVVGVGHAHMGLQRFMALGLALGRAVVFSHCSSPSDSWAVTGRSLFKAAHPYECAESHLVFGDHYRGPGGIDFRWNHERQELFRRCGLRETSLDLNAADLPRAPKPDNPNWAFTTCKKSWKGCASGWNADQMGCDFRSKARCPDINSILGDVPYAPLPVKAPATTTGKRGGGGTGSKAGSRSGGKGSARRAKLRPPTDGRRLARSPPSRTWLRRTATTRADLPKYYTAEALQRYANTALLSLYNARRDAGTYMLPSWHIALANGAASVRAPNGSTVGIATSEDIRDTLACPYDCWAHANFRPAAQLRKLIRHASRKLRPGAPLACVHLRTMWVDDHRCVSPKRTLHTRGRRLRLLSSLQPLRL